MIQRLRFVPDLFASARRRPLSPACGILVLLAVVCLPRPAQAEDFGLLVDGGDWQSATTWTPSGGPPGAADRVFIAWSHPFGALDHGGVGLSADAAVGAVLTGGSGAAAIDLNGFSLSAENLQVAGPTTIDRSAGGSIHFDQIFLMAGDLSLEPGDELSSGASVSDATLQVNAPLSMSWLQIGTGGQVHAAASLSLETASIGGGTLAADDGISATHMIDLQNGTLQLLGGTLSADALSLDNGTLERGANAVQVNSLYLSQSSMTHQGADSIGSTLTLGAGAAVTLEKDLEMPAGLINAFNGGELALNGHALTVANLSLTDATVTRGVGGSVHLDALFLLAGDLSLEPGDELSSGAIVSDATLQVNAPLSMSWLQIGIGGQVHAAASLSLETASIGLGGTLDATAGISAYDLTVDGTLNLHGSTLAAGVLGWRGNIDRGLGGAIQTGVELLWEGSATFQGDDAISVGLEVHEGAVMTLHKNLATGSWVDLYPGSTLDLNGQSVTTPRLGVRGDAAVIRGAGDSVHLEHISLENGASFTIRPGDELTSTAYLFGPASILEIDVPLDMDWIQAGGSSIVAIRQLPGADNGVTLEQFLAIDDSSTLSLVFDSTGGPGDWIFRWSDDHVAELLTMHVDGRLTWTSDLPVAVIYGDDGYTYITQVPEPGGFALLAAGLLALLAIAAPAWKRRAALRSHG